MGQLGCIGAKDKVGSAVGGSFQQQEANEHNRAGPCQQESSDSLHQGRRLSHLLTRPLVRRLRSLQPQHRRLRQRGTKDAGLRQADTYDPLDQEIPCREGPHSALGKRARHHKGGGGGTGENASRGIRKQSVDHWGNGNIGQTAGRSPSDSFTAAVGRHPRDDDNWGQAGNGREHRLSLAPHPSGLSCLPALSRSVRPSAFL